MKRVPFSLQKKGFQNVFFVGEKVLPRTRKGSTTTGTRTEQTQCLYDWLLVHMRSSPFRQAGKVFLGWDQINLGGVFLNKKVNSLPFEKVRKASEHKVQHVKHWAEQFYAIQDVRDPRQADASEWPCSLTSDRHWSWKTHTVRGLEGLFTTHTKATSSPGVTALSMDDPDLISISYGRAPPSRSRHPHPLPWLRCIPSLGVYLNQSLWKKRGGYQPTYHSKPLLARLGKHTDETLTN